MQKKDSYFKGLTRRDYIAVTNDIIHKEGLQAISIRRIAKEMGCSSASLYRHFESRDELLYYAELGEMNDYIRSLNKEEKHWKNVWDIYVGVWYCYSLEAFRKPEAYNLLFFTYDNNKLRESIREYYSMFPETIGSSNRMFHNMLQTSDFMGRDFAMCRNCIRANAILYEDAVSLNRMVCMLFKGYFKTVYDEGILEEEIEERVW
nr:TetR/AcrR family transcriptional regulator [uncultured Sellimonas sp.]